MNGESLIGKVLGGRYELLEVIGSGGMATVFKAHCRFLDRNVAVKIIRASLVDDEQALKKFDAEARAAARLSHHNIVSIYDVGETDGLNYIVMELVEGMTLKEYIKKKGALDWKEACDFAVQIAMALECAHANGIIHRDIKPHNILLTKDGTLKVADFGIARTTTSDTLVAKGDSTILGSAHYISPEQARGGYVDKKSDVYSLGVVFYEMLAGQVPFDGENPVSVAMMKLEKDPPNCKIHNPDIPQAVAEIAMKAIAKEQHNRYQSAMDMAMDVKSLLDRQAERKIGKTEVEDTETENGLEDKITKFLLIGSLVLVLVLAAGAYYLFSGGSKEMQVPDLMNLTLEEAIERAVEFDFTVDEEKILYQVSEDIEEGRVMKQEPGANSFTKKNKIRLVISSGETEGEISVPSVVGKDIEEAIAILTKEKLKYRQVMERNNSYDVDVVFGQSPREGTRVNADTVIVLHVCDGPVLEETEEPGETVTVPKVVGYDADKAKAMLAAAGLEASIEEKESEEAEGKVLSQSPKAESMAPKGSSVRLVISKGPAPTESPAPSEEPTQAPQKPTEEPMKQKTLTIPLNESLGESVQIKVVANGKVIWDKKHATSEGKVDIPVASRTDATVEVYFDGVLQTTKVVTF